MPSINDVPRRVIHAKDPTVKKKLDIGLKLPPGANPFFAVATWGASKEQKAAQAIEVEQDVEVEETSLDGKSSMNALFSLFTHSARSSATAESTPLDSSSDEPVVTQTVPEAAAEAVDDSVHTPIADTPVIQAETIDISATSLQEKVADEPMPAVVLDSTPNAPALNVEQLSFDIIPAAPEVEAGSVEKPKGVRRISAESARKIRLVNSALIAYASLFSEEEAPIPENVVAKKKRMPAPDSAREALAELLGMQQKDDIDGILGILETTEEVQVDDKSVDNNTPSA